ncbi:MAG: glycoside hydrolase family 3 protein [Candidatus Paceibacterota bacterium]
MDDFKVNAKLVYLFLFLIILVGIFYFLSFLFRNEETKIVRNPTKESLYLNPNNSVEERVEDLLSYMTLEEKIGQMALVENKSVEEMKDVSLYGLGALLSGAGANPENNTPEGWNKMVSDFINESKNSRLGIPIIYGVDAIHGHSNIPGATVFPHSIGLGATRDPKLVEDIASATAKELLATNVHWSFSPTLDMPRDIRWGRVYETFSDDPALVSDLGVAYIKGLQGNSVIGTAKHFVGLGGMLWDTSSNENYKIDQGATLADEELLREEYLVPFRAVVDAGVKSVMIGLNTWGETKLSASEYLITDVLKKELGFKGFVVSDWYGVYEIPGSDYRSVITAINAGVDMVMLPFDYKPFVKNVSKAVRVGEVSEDRIDDAVRRILYAKFELGLFDKNENKISTEVVGSVEHRALARDAVSQSLVLLKNDNSVLPIDKNIKHIRIVGSAANNIGNQSGAWTVNWQGINGNDLPGATSIIDGIKNAVSENTRVDYRTLGNFVDDGTKADLGIAFVGEQPYAEGVGDREYPILYSEDLMAIKKLQAVSEKVLVVIISGRPLLIANEISSWDALVAAWLPGSEGQGVADVLFGDKPFVGKLPLPWPATSQQLPITRDGITADSTPVLFPRYFGLEE